jgi:hypothetical protein
MSRPPQRGEWAGAVISLGAQMLQLPLLPFRLLGLGVQVMTQALGAGQQAVAELERDGEPPGAVPAPAAPAGSGDRVQPAWVEIERARGFFTGGPIGQEAFSVNSISNSINDENFAGGAASSGAAAGCSETYTKEDKDMSCNCDQSLSGCELKIVQYSIVSVSPYIQDAERIIIPMNTIATSDDMTGEDFTALVIARNMRDDPDRFRRYDMQYIRVCYFVLCRLSMPCADYERQQAEALRDINRTLRDHKLGDGRPYDERLSSLVRTEEAPAPRPTTDEGGKKPR